MSITTAHINIFHKQAAFMAGVFLAQLMFFLPSSAWAFYTVTFGTDAEPIRRICRWQ